MKKHGEAPEKALSQHNSFYYHKYCQTAAITGKIVRIAVRSLGPAFAQTPCAHAAPHQFEQTSNIARVSRPSRGQSSARLRGGRHARPAEFGAQSMALVRLGLRSSRGVEHRSTAPATASTATYIRRTSVANIYNHRQSRSVKSSFSVLMLIKDDPCGSLFLNLMEREEYIRYGWRS